MKFKFIKPSEEEMKTVDDIREENIQELLVLKKKKRRIILRLAYIFLLVVVFYLVIKWEFNLLDSYNVNNIINNGNNSEEKKEILLESLELTVEKDTISVGEKLKINVTYKPSNATDKKLTWESNNEKAVTVENGVVTGISPGEALITVKGSNYTSKVIMIYVQ